MSTVKQRNGTGGRKSLQAGKGTGRQPPGRAGGAPPPPDELAEWVARAKEMPMVRRELVERIRAEIDSGTYETPERIEAAIDRLLEELKGS